MMRHRLSTPWTAGRDARFSRRRMSPLQLCRSHWRSSLLSTTAHIPTRMAYVALTRERFLCSCCGHHPSPPSPPALPLPRRATTLLASHASMRAGKSPSPPIFQPPPHCYTSVSHVLLTLFQTPIPPPPLSLPTAVAAAAAVVIALAVAATRGRGLCLAHRAALRGGSYGPLRAGLSLSLSFSARVRQGEATRSN